MSRNLAFLLRRVVSMYLIVGLGNPGTKYARTRHNAGFLVVDALGDPQSPRPPNSVRRERAKGEGGVGKLSTWRSFASVDGEVSEGEIGSEKVILLKPHTYMNLSGKSVSAAMKKFKITTDHLIVVHDDMDFSFGTVKVQRNRSSAGHNGVQSIIDALHTKDFTRVRVGVGPRPAAVAGDVFVLQRFNAEEIAMLKNDIVPKSVALILKNLKSVPT